MVQDLKGSEMTRLYEQGRAVLQQTSGRVQHCATYPSAATEGLRMLQHDVTPACRESLCVLQLIEAKHGVVRGSVLLTACDMCMDGGHALSMM